MTRVWAGVDAGKAHHRPLILLSGYQTAAAIRAAGTAGLEAWLRERKVRNAGKLAELAAAAAARQQIALPGEQLTAQMIATLAGEVMALGEQTKHTGKLIEGRFHQHELAAAITNLPGIGTLLGAEFLAATGGDMDFSGTPDRLAGFAGLAPAPWDSGGSAATCTGASATTVASTASSTTPP
jgi:transposase